MSKIFKSVTRKEARERTKIWKEMNKWKKKYREVGDFRENRAEVQDKDSLLWGVVDEKGREVIECKYNYIGYFNENRAEVQDKDSLLYGFVDREWIEVIECKYRCVGFFRENRARVWDIKGRWFYIDRDGKEVEG